MELSSCLYECVVSHHRLRPRDYAFEHRIMMLYADLDELPAIHRSSRLLSHDRANLYSFRDGDYCPTGAPGDLRARLSGWLHEQGIALSSRCRIRLLTLPRVLGYIFNPISIYFCAAEDGSPLCAVAEVGNTFRETKLFLLPPGEASPASPARFRARLPKHYYVSPFSSPDISFDFDCLQPGSTLQVHIEDWDADGQLLVSHLRGRRRPLSDTQLALFAVRFPALTLKVITLIHWHALRLWLKRVPWYRKGAHADLQRNVINPSREKHAH
jgi:uncharacterized protein